MLLERPGELVTREELRTALWPSDTFVDFEHGLHAGVNRLREALGDSADSPRLVETLPRRGYRFIGAITPFISVPQPLEGESAAQPVPAAVGRNHATGARGLWLKVGVWVLAAAAVALTVAFIYPRSRPRAAPVTLSPVPFTTYEGTETMPSFSPDGSRIAFAWDGDPPPGSKGFDLYVKVIGSENLLRLTRHPSPDWIASAWSPDGTQIAFHRISGSDAGVYVVPALGGPERKLRSTRELHRTGALIDWSRDGKWIAFQDSLPPDNLVRIYLLSLETFDSRQIPHAAECIGEKSPMFSHDGKQLAYTCWKNMGNMESGMESGINIVATSGGQPRQVRTPGKTLTGWGPLMGLVWTADDKRLIFPGDFQAGGGDFELYELTLADGSLRRIPLGQDAIWPTVSPKGDKLAYATYSFHLNIWRKDLLHPESAAAKLISSTWEQEKPSYSPDGKHIAFLSNRSGFAEIWMSDADGTQPVQISNLNGSETEDPSWSPDGKMIAFDSGQSSVSEGSGVRGIYIVDISERIPRKLITNIFDAKMPSWSHDGKWIYFMSRGPDGTKVYRCPATGGDAVLLAALPSTEQGLYPVESFDGETVYFAGSESNTLLYAVSLRNPGMKVALKEMPTIARATFSTIAPGGIYFVAADAPTSIRYFDFHTKHVHQIFESDKRFWHGLSVSPDGHWILYVKVDDENQDIMLVDQFR
jgi:Tol biopolymer transport system component